MFSCFYCFKQFTKKAKLKDHIIEKVCLKKTHFCWCGKGCLSLNALHVHKSKHHAVRAKLNTTPLNFVDFSAFESWKQSIEEETLSKFVKPRTSFILKNGNKKTKFVCHRSGKIRLKTEQRKRAGRKKGSCKLDAFCPAFITIEEDMHGLIKGEFYGSHNHESEIQYLTLSQEEKKKIADSLNKGATFEDILDDVQNSSNFEYPSKRFHTLKRKDLHNIMREFKISFTERLARDATNIHSLVQECEQRFGENSPMKLFKPQNVDGVEGMEGANAEDFILIIITSAQKQILAQCKHNQIYVDTSHGIKGLDFHLTSVLAMNGSGLCLPVAFCISNIVNANILNIFFAIINKECGNILTSTFTSKDFPIFINAWCKVMSVPDKWQVDKNLSQNLQKMMINDELDHITRTLVEEMDNQLLTPFSLKFVEKLLGNESTKEYGQFLVHEYYDSFSDCLVDYKKHAEIHTNSKLDVMYRVLKEIYFKGIKVRRLDFSVFRLLKMAWDNLFVRLTFMKKENGEYMFKMYKNRHDASTLIPYEDIIKRDQSYEVRSASNAEKTYLLEKEFENCSCQLRCADCDSCLHIYSCSCIDFSIAENVCKHVHAVVTFEKTLAAKSIFCHSEDVNKSEILFPVEDNSYRKKKKNCIRDSKQELIDALYQLSLLIQTKSYDAKVYEEGAGFVRKTLDLFSENSSTKNQPQPSEFKKEEDSVFSKDIIICDKSVCEEASEQLRVEEVKLMLVDEVVEEIVIVDMHPADDSYV